VPCPPYALNVNTPLRCYLVASPIQLPEHDMPWLESWARAVVYASKTDTSERIRQRRAPKADTRSEIPETDASERGARTHTQG
ncbi:unnamed protein product, partial [Ectocarpus sp. 12 AP-2014]